MRFQALLLVLAVTACSDCPDPFELSERRVLVPGQGVVLTAPDGELRVEGRERATMIEIEARGCGAGRGASIEIDTLGPIASERTVRIAAPGADVRVLLPAGAPMEVSHGSGDVELRAVGPTTLFTRAGRAVVEQAIGEVRVSAGAGPLYVRHVMGDVDVVDGGGAVFVEDVIGSVHVHDGSGGIHLRQVEGDAVVGSDAGGSIEVRDVSGDFTVLAKSDDIRMIRHTNVGGTVRLPPGSGSRPAPARP